MNDHLAQSIDFMPTLLKAAGVEVPADLHGVDLLDDAALAKRDSIFGECFTHNSMDLNKPAASLKWRWMIEGSMKLIVPNKANQPDDLVELYDLKADPTEEKNLAAENADKVKALSAKLDAWWKP